MPYSDPRFDKSVEKFIESHKFTDYFDIGAGAGKYGRMIRSQFPQANIIGLEADKSYIKEFKLKNTYTKIYHEYIEKFIDKNPDFTTEITIIGDCLEHLKKSDGVNLINYLLYRAKFILIVYPTQCVQYSWKGHATEAHRSVWDKDDFAGFQHQVYKKGFMNLVIIKGFLSDPKTIYVED